MVTFKNEKSVTSEMIITISDSGIEDIESMQNALITALVELNRNSDFDFGSESYYIGEILKNLQPTYEVLKTGFENTPENEFLRLKKPLTEPQTNEIRRLIYEFDKTEN